MSDIEPRPVSPNVPVDSSQQLPAVPRMAPAPLGMPLPAAPWMDVNEKKDGFNFAGFFHSLRRRWLLGLGIGCLVASVVAALLWLLVPIKYEAFVQIRVHREQDEVMPNQFRHTQTTQDYEIMKKTQSALMRSPFV